MTLGSTRDLIRQALYDAIGWQAGLADAWPEGSPERNEALEHVRAYRKILKRRYGDGRLPDSRMFAGCSTITLDDLRKQRIDGEARDKSSK